VWGASYEDSTAVCDLEDKIMGTLSSQKLVL